MEFGSSVIDLQGLFASADHSVEVKARVCARYHEHVAVRMKMEVKYNTDSI